MKVKNWDGWERDWLNLVDHYRAAPTGPGVYLICADHAINRAVGVDENGILTIGESGNLRDRLGRFVGCVQGRHAKGHMAGWRFFNSALSKPFPIETLWVSWCEMPSKEDAYRKEGEMLGLYLSQHYELPPLNYKFNWSAQEQ